LLRLTSGFCDSRAAVPEWTGTLERFGSQMSVLRLAVLLIGLLALVGCSRDSIPNTDVEDNDFNRGVLEFCEEYRRAVEHRNIARLLQMASEDYYEDGGNIDTSDDLDRAGLEEYLKDRFRKTKAIRYEVRYRRIGKGRNDVIYVDYTYSASYKLATKHGEVWRRTVADNRLEIVPHQESYRIVSGM
jgi:hypothetical protein